MTFHDTDTIPDVTISGALAMDLMEILQYAYGHARYRGSQMAAEEIRSAHAALMRDVQDAEQP
jgi:hypothetical protein